MKNQLQIIRGYLVDGGGGSIPGRVKIFLFSTAVRPALGSTKPSIQQVPGFKGPGPEAEHSSPPRAKVRNGGAIPPLRYMSSWHNAYLIQHGQVYIFTVYKL
jgi:hypothetical protein